MTQTAASKQATEDQDMNEQASVPDMKDIVALCKRRGFIFAASDIYGGINGFWDYGPLGTALKNNIRDLWWKAMVVTPPIGPDGEPLQIVGLDSAIIQNPKVWEASGHVGGFSDPMVDCKETKKRYRADHLVAYVPDPLEFENENALIPVFIEDTPKDEREKKFKKLGISNSHEYRALPLTSIDKFGYKEDEYDDFWRIEPVEAATKPINKTLFVGPDAKEPSTLTEPKEFNLLFETSIGAVKDDASIAYLRGETAQGIFINFKNVVDSSRVRIPFGIAQIGKAFRNEVTPRNFIFRSREFEQMEMEWFCHPDEAQQWFEFWKAERSRWWNSIGVKSDNLILREHGADELVFYSKGTYDIEYRFPFTAPGFGELEGVAYRGEYDLTQHQEGSGQKLEYLDPVEQKKFMPHVIEPAAGLTRGVLAVLCEAYTVDPERPSGVYLNFHPSVAPIKAAILPLTAKEDHVPLATKIYMELREHFAVELDIKQNIGKRYARQDEIGTPFCFTVDDESVSDATVTVRHRNTMKQERIAIDNIIEFMRKEMAAM